MYYKNTLGKQEYKLSINTDYSTDNHKDWYAKNNFGTNNFGLNLLVLPISKMRHNVSLYILYAIAYKILLYFRCDNSNPVCLFFKELWGNICYSNQFKNIIELNHL